MGADGGYTYYDYQKLTNHKCMAKLQEIYFDEYFNEGPTGDCWMTYAWDKEKNCLGEKVYRTLEEHHGVKSKSEITIEMMAATCSTSISILRAKDYSFLKFDVVRFSWGTNVPDHIRDMGYEINVDELISEETWT